MAYIPAKLLCLSPGVFPHFLFLYSAFERSAFLSSNRKQGSPYCRLIRHLRSAIQNPGSSDVAKIHITVVKYSLCCMRASYCMYLFLFPCMFATLQQIFCHLSFCARLLYCASHYPQTPAKKSNSALWQPFFNPYHPPYLFSLPLRQPAPIIVMD